MKLKDIILNETEQTEKAAYWMTPSFNIQIFKYIETENTSVIALGQDWKLRLTTKCHEVILGLHGNVLKIKFW